MWGTQIKIDNIVYKEVLSPKIPKKVILKVGFQNVPLGLLK